MVYASDREACRLDALLYVRGGAWGAPLPPNSAHVHCVPFVHNVAKSSLAPPSPLEFFCAYPCAHGACSALCTSTLLYKSHNENCLFRA